jgi:hypothetical protein
MKPSHLEGSITSDPKGSPVCVLPTNPESVLRELSDLLEEYAPAWYTEELHHRVVLALDIVPNHG